jgi:hypothetical protein
MRIRRRTRDAIARAVVQSRTNNSDFFLRISPMVFVLISNQGPLTGRIGLKICKSSRALPDRLLDKFLAPDVNAVIGILERYNAKTGELADSPLS